MMDLTRGPILVTGGAGFIGSAVVWELNQRGITDIVIADYLGKDEKWKNLVALKFADYLEADELLRRVERGTDGLPSFTAVFHLGACSATTETDAAYLIRNNFEFTKLLAHWTLRRRGRFLYASSAATYGERADGVAESTPLASLRPLNIYGYSKHLFDQYAERAGILPLITGLKYFNIYGPNEDHKGEMRSLVNKAFAEIRNSGEMSLFKSYRPEYRDGEQKRDFLYVKDAVAATLFVAEHVEGGGLFNIGSGEPNTWLALAQAIFHGLNLEPRIAFVEMPEQLRPKYQYFTCANIDKLKAAGWRTPFRSLQAAVGDYVTGYLLPGKHLGDERLHDEHLGSEQASASR